MKVVSRSEAGVGEGRGPGEDPNCTWLIWRRLKPLGRSPRVTITVALTGGPALKMTVFSSPRSGNQDRNPDCILNARVVPLSYLPGSRKREGQAQKATVRCSGSRSQSQHFVWLSGCGKRQKREKLFCWSGWSVCNEAPGALSEQRQKTPLESFTLAREVPIPLSSPSGPGASEWLCSTLSD